MIKEIFLVAILLCGTLALSGQVRPDEKEITYTTSGDSLSLIFDAISSIADVNIAYSNALIPPDNQFKVGGFKKPISYFLNKVLDKTELTYKLVGNQIVIIKDEYKFAPDKLTISGRVVDRENGEALPFAAVYSYDNTFGTEANEYGYYSITVSKGLKRLYYTHLGYDKNIREVKLKKDTTINIGLGPKALLNEVLIVDKLLDRKRQNINSTNEMPVDRIRSIASLGGEPDVIRLAHLTAGVSTGADGLGGLAVRGGSSDQNLILLDGVPVYGPGHAFGVFSVFNSNIIKSAKLYKGSMPSKYNGRLSSVFDIRTKDGDQYKSSGEIALGVIAFKGMLEGPLSKGKSSYIFSFRRTFVDPWLGNLSETINDFNGSTGRASYYFYDFNGKINLHLNDNHNLIASYYRGSDVYNNEVNTVIDNSSSSEEFSDTEWNNRNDVGLLRLNSKWNSKLFSRMSLYLSNYKSNLFDYDRRIDVDVVEDINYQIGLLSSEVRDLGFQLDFDYSAGSYHNLFFGIEGIQHALAPGAINFSEDDNLVAGRDLVTNKIVEARLDEVSSSIIELSAYLEDELTFSERFKLRLGISARSFLTDTQTYNYLQPRAALLYHNAPFHIKLGYGQHVQYLHQLVNSGLGLPSEVLISSDDLIRPSTANVFNAGFGFDFDNGYSISTELFYKEYSDLINNNTGPISDITSLNDWQSDLVTGTGLSYGIEAALSRSIGQSIWYINYTFTESTREFDDLNLGQPFEYALNRPHQFKLNFVRKINKNSEFALNWIYGTGNPVSVPDAIQPYIDEEGNLVTIPKFVAKNNGRLPDYHRLDISFSFFNDFSWARQRFTLGLYNAYDRKNPGYLDINKDRDRVNRFVLNQYSIIRILPTVSYSLSF